jgi:hypothetical protein
MSSREELEMERREMEYERDHQYEPSDEDIKKFLEIYDFVEKIFVEGSLESTLSNKEIEKFILSKNIDKEALWCLYYVAIDPKKISLSYFLECKYEESVAVDKVEFLESIFTE